MMYELNLVLCNVFCYFLPDENWYIFLVSDLIYSLLSGNYIFHCFDWELISGKLLEFLLDFENQSRGRL